MTVSYSKQFAKSIGLFTLVLVTILLVRPGSLKAQLNQKYRMANQLMDEKKYEEAYDILQKLMDENPQVYALYDRATTCLIQLKQYEKAIDLSKKQLKRSGNHPRVEVRMGELYHLNGDTTRAFNIWDRVLKEQPDNLQVYLTMARTMRDRRAYDRAVKVYEKARQKYSNSNLFINEVASTYLLAGEYRNAIREFLKLIERNPDQTDFVRRSFMRFNDDHLFELATLEIEEHMRQMQRGTKAYKAIHDLRMWLLMEQKLYRRAVAVARSYEEQTNEVTFALFNLGRRLLSEQQYELAEKAYRYYADQNENILKYRSIEQLADVHMQWAHHLTERNLAFAQKRDSLYQVAYTELQRIPKEDSNYSRMDEVFIKLAELSLDHLNDVDQAQAYLDKLRSHIGQKQEPRADYVQGRLYLYQHNYDRARIAFTRSHKAAEGGEMANKTRYYLGLTDFYAGDYEYSLLQLKALARQSTSFYANDAVQLRVWIQEGQQADSTGHIIDPFARGLQLLEQEQHDKAIPLLVDSVLTKGARHPLRDDALLQISKNARNQDLVFAYTLLDQYLSGNPHTPLHERLLWEKARLADRMLSSSAKSRESENQISEQQQKLLDRLGYSAASMPKNAGEVGKLYEDLLVAYPQGYYASYARDRLRELQNKQT